MAKSKVHIFFVWVFYKMLCGLVAITKNRKLILYKIVMGSALISLLYGTSCRIFRRHRGTCHSVRMLENVKLKEPDMCNNKHNSLINDRQN